MYIWVDLHFHVGMELRVYYAQASHVGVRKTYCYRTNTRTKIYNLRGQQMSKMDTNL